LSNPTKIAKSIDHHSYYHYVILIVILTVSQSAILKDKHSDAEWILILTTTVSHSVILIADLKFVQLYSNKV